MIFSQLGNTAYGGVNGARLNRGGHPCQRSYAKLTDILILPFFFLEFRNRLCVGTTTLNFIGKMGQRYVQRQKGTQAPDHWGPAAFRTSRVRLTAEPRLWCYQVTGPDVFEANLPSCASGRRDGEPYRSRVERVSYLAYFLKVGRVNQMLLAKTAA